MPGKIKTKIICARNLPIMDRSSDSSDAFVEIRFGSNIYDKTPVYKKSLDPVWNSKFVFEVEEDEIQEDPLQIRVLDHDTYSSHDAIGKVYIDLKPLLNPRGPSSIDGFIPIYDTLHGIRGEIKIQAKIELFSDCNEYRKSSSGVLFFCSSKIPEGYILQNFYGFVEELVINDDPEYQWMDKIRTPRTSNEARQKLFTKLSGEVQRRIGLKVIEMGANSVLGYLQNFDLEGEHGIVVRGIGTAANIYKFNSQVTDDSSNTDLSSIVFQQQNMLGIKINTNDETLSNENKQSNNLGEKNINQITNTAQFRLNKLSPNRLIGRIHSDSDLKTYQQQQQQQTGHLNQAQCYTQLGHQSSVPPNLTTQQAESTINKQSVLEKIEYPFLTIQQYPIGFIKSLCGIVCARSVKLMTSSSNEDDLESRDKWWNEIRNEIRSQLVSLNCHVVLGYSENRSICEDVCVLSASGTAAIVDETYFSSPSSFDQSNHSPPNEQQQQQQNSINNFVDLNSHSYSSFARCSSSANNSKAKSCKLCHIPYSENELPFPVALSNCANCGQGLVPDIIFTSIQPLQEVETIGQGCLLRAIVTRPRKKASGEASAKLISDYLPFMEYELHRQLLGKLKLKAMNMLYGLKVQISLGENLIIGMAEATACYAAALPQPMIPKIVYEKGTKTKQEIDEIEQLKKLLIHEMNKNKEFFNLNTAYANKKLKPLTSTNHPTMSAAGSNSSGSQNADTDLVNSSLSVVDPKALFKIELDDFRESDSVLVLLDSSITHKKGFYLCSTEHMPGLDKLNKHLQMFTSVYRCETSLVQMNTKKFNEICDEILETLQFKFRKYPNCLLTNLSFDSSLYDDDHAMIILTGCCLTFNEKECHEDRPENPATATVKVENKGVEVTSLSYIPNQTIDSYLGLINLFLIRESTQIKEYGGLSGFMHCFIGEVLAMCRAHVLSLGGNALVSFRMNECVLLDNPHKNQGQCLINVSGDAVRTRPIAK